MKLIHKFTEEELLLTIGALQDYIAYLECTIDIINNEGRIKRLSALKRILSKLDC